MASAEYGKVYKEYEKKDNECEIKDEYVASAEYGKVYKEYGKKDN